MRLKFSFWLDDTKPDDVLLMEEIAHLKQNRLFAKTIRDGIRLLGTLRAGDVTVLLELFPNILAMLKQHDSGGNGGGDPEAIQELRQELEQLKTALILRTPPQNSGHAELLQKPPGNPKPLASLKPVMPPVDDDSDLIDIKNDTSTESAANFLASCMALQQ